MKKITVFGLLFLGLTACGNSVSQQTNQPSTNINGSRNETVIASHSTQSAATPPSVNQTNTATSNPHDSNSSAGGSPMAKAVDVSQMTAAIEKAEKESKAKPNDAKAKNALAEAYFVRAFALTDAAQYRSALGDFRKGLKLNPDNADAKGMHDQIINIFQSIGREPPKEGEEPPPLPPNK